MKRLVGSIVVLVALVIVALPVAAAIVAPPAINMPAGGKVVTEVNLTDNDVLGIVKQSIPAIGDLLKQLAPAAAPQAGSQPTPDWAKQINLDEFSQAISGVTGVRLLIAEYPKEMTAERFVAEFSSGVAKTGQFSKLLIDNAVLPGGVGIFSAADNSGIIGFVYDPDGHTAYAFRVVGRLDIPKLIHWVGEVAKVFGVNYRTEMPTAPTQPVPDAPTPNIPAPQPPEAK